MGSAREAILKGATKLFSEKVLRQFHSGDRQAAGVTKPVILLPFRSKEHLYHELMLDIFNQTQEPASSFHFLKRESC